MKANLIMIGIIIVLAIVLLFSINKYNKLLDEYSISIENIKSYESILSGNNDDKRLLKLTIEQLNYSNDSIIKKIKNVLEELKIKDNKLKLLLYQSSHAERIDSIILKDTIFINDFLLDTIVGDKWFKSNLLLKYPNLIVIKPEIELERYTIISSKKETIKPPKKFFLWRWFLKKHTIIEVNTRELNPYVRDKTLRFIQIIE